MEPSKRDIIEELGEITDLVVCVGMATHSFDESDSVEAVAMRTLCITIASRLRDIQEFRDRFEFPRNEGGAHGSPD